MATFAGLVILCAYDPERRFSVAPRSMQVEASGDQDPGFTQAQLAQVDMSGVLAEERDQEIRKIVESITELAQVRGCARRACGLAALHRRRLAYDEGNLSANQ